MLTIHKRMTDKHGITKIYSLEGYGNAWKPENFNNDLYGECINIAIS